LNFFFETKKKFIVENMAWKIPLLLIGSSLACSTQGFSLLFFEIFCFNFEQKSEVWSKNYVVAKIGIIFGEKSNINFVQKMFSIFYFSDFLPFPSCFLHIK